MGLSQLRRLKSTIGTRNKLANLYKKQLYLVPGVSFPKNAFLKKTNAWHLFTVFIDFKAINLKKRDFCIQLQKKGIGTQVHYIPLFFQPIYKIKDKKKYLGAIEYYEKNLSLPMYTGLKSKDVIYICEIVKSIILKSLKNK